jgi:oligopeptide transport system substrate-binding protein
MRIERVRTEGPSGAIRISRRDFLKIGGTGLAGAALLGTAGCGVFQQGGGQQGGGGGGNSVVWNIGDTIRDMNSTTTTDSASTDILMNVMSGLYRLDVNTKPVPDMAKSVDISEDKLTYTFTLRDGVKWSNGDPVTSQDFKYAWLRAIDPKTAGQYAYIITTFVKGANEFNTGKGSADDVAIETPDDKTLKVTLVAPSPFWLGLTSFFTYLPQKQSFVEQQGDQYAQNADALIYNGPYLLTKFNPTEGTTMVKNKDYWNASNVALQSNEGKIVKELDTAVNLYESGDIDEIQIEGEYVDQYKGSPPFQTRTFFATFYMVGNYELPFFQNENIRRAFQMGFDRDTLVNKILNSGAVAATGYVPDGLAGPGDQTFREAEGPTMPAYDAQQAKELFQKGTQELGSNPTIELLAYDDSTARDIATFLQSQFEDNLGANISVKVQPFDRKLELESNGEFQLSWQGWIADYDDPMTFLDLWLSDSSFNTQKYKNDRYDELVNGAKEETDFAKRMDMLLEAEKLLVEEDAAVAPIYFDGRSYLVRPFITRFINQPYGGGRDISLWKVKG